MELAGDDRQIGKKGGENGSDRLTNAGDAGAPHSSPLLSVCVAGLPCESIGSTNKKERLMQLFSRGDQARSSHRLRRRLSPGTATSLIISVVVVASAIRSEEHTSELQSQSNL